MSEWLRKFSEISNQIRPVLDYNWLQHPYLRMDLSRDNNQLAEVDLNDEREFTDFIFSELKEADASFGVGGYAEQRELYSRSNLFLGKEQRTIHLGIDIWGKAGTLVHAPLDGKVHSFANNAVHGDYGPVIILKHQIEGTVFHTLYGHLSTNSLTGLSKGKLIKAGEAFASFGVYSENFHWPPHLHFQAIIDMQGYEGDYPGVCKASEKEFYLNNCPDPATLLSLR